MQETSPAAQSTSTPAAPDDEQVKITLARVHIGNVSPGAVSAHYARSLHEMRAANITEGWNCIAGIIEATSGAQISRGRNDVVREFLAKSATDGAEWLLFLDSDMAFPPDLIPRLQLAAHVSGADAIGGLCVTVDPDGPPKPTLFKYDTVPGSAAFTRVMLDYPENALIQVAATGTACLMIHRDALVEMRDSAGHDFAWFAEDVHRVDRYGRTEHHWASEDVEFCHRLNELGRKVVVDTTLKIGHHKHGRIWTADDIATWSTVRRPAIAAVIPYKGYLDMTDNLVRRLLSSRVDRIWLVNNGLAGELPDIAVDADADLVTVLHRCGAGIHEMWNAGIDAAVDAYGARVHVALLNNDIEVCPDFLPLLSGALLEHPGYMVVGGNYDGRDPMKHPAVIRTDDICAERYDGTGGLPGFAFMINGSALSGGYRFPTDARWWYGDNDLLLTLRSTREARRTPGQWLAGIVTAAACRHAGAATARDWSAAEWGPQLAADRAAFERKWGAWLIAAKTPEDVATLLAAGGYDDALTELATRDSDIRDHLHTLRALAVDHGAGRIVELGVRTGVSTVAWLSAAEVTDGHVWAVDTGPLPAHVTSAPRCEGIVGRSTDEDVVRRIVDKAGGHVDLVFIDTDHTLELTWAELMTWAPHVYAGGAIVLHDTAVRRFAHHEGRADVAAQPDYPVATAVAKWLDDPASDGWHVESEVTHCHGLTVLRRGGLWMG